MKLNNSTNIPNEVIREIISFVRPSGISKFDVELKNSKHAFAGRAYMEGSSYHSSWSPFIVVRIGDEKHFPYFDKKRIDYLKSKGRGGYLPQDFYTRLEAVTHLLAHELRHLWQAKHPKGWRVWGAKGKYSERDADAFAIQKVRQFRRLFNYDTMKFNINLKNENK